MWPCPHTGGRMKGLPCCSALCPAPSPREGARTTAQGRHQVQNCSRWNEEESPRASPCVLGHSQCRHTNLATQNSLEPGRAETTVKLGCKSLLCPPPEGTSDSAVPGVLLSLCLHHLVSSHYVITPTPG